MQNVSKMPRTPVSVENFILPSKYAKNVCLSLLWVHWDVYKLVHNKSCCCCYVTSVVSDPVRPYRRQPTRLPSPWDSPGKNTGVGCHFLLQYVIKLFQSPRSPESKWHLWVKINGYFCLKWWLNAKKATLIESSK